MRRSIKSIFRIQAMLADVGILEPDIVDGVRILIEDRAVCRADRFALLEQVKRIGDDDAEP
jgi:hypothetical protein